jgi:carboxymethylenebutenolidase
MRALPKPGCGAAPGVLRNERDMPGIMASMCFPYRAVPPEIPASFRRRPPIAGGAAGEPLTLTAADGIPFSAYLARAEGEAGVVVLPDVRGLFRFYEELAERFAEAGVPAVAIDYFGRTAGLGSRGEDFDYQPHVKETRPETIVMDVRAAVERLKVETGVTRTYVVGFCFGGRQAFLQAAAGQGLDGVVGFYGSLADRPPHARPADVAGSITCPVLALFGGGDHHIPPEQVAEFEHALEQAGVEHEVHTYPGAPHSFFDRRAEDYAAESQDAWERILGFISTGRVAAAAR